MGDFRAGIKIEMHLINKKYKTDMSINYWDDGDGNDERVKEWFRDCYNDARSRYNKMIYDSQAKERKAAEEKAERALYAKLKKKFDPQEPTV